MIWNTLHGVYLDWELNFDNHISYVHSKSVKKLGVLKKSRQYLDKDTSVLLYKSLVLPHLDYCDTVYECTSKANLTKLQQIQTSACRTLLLADKFTSTASMHKSLGLLSLENRRKYHRAVDCHKHIHNEKSSLTKYFVDKQMGRATRSGELNKKVVPDIRSNMGRNA